MFAQVGEFGDVDMDVGAGLFQNELVLEQLGLGIDDGEEINVVRSQGLQGGLEGIPCLGDEGFFVELDAAPRLAQEGDMFFSLAVELSA